MSTKWFGGWGLFRHKRSDPKFVPRWEERTVLVGAGSLEEAEGLILAEFASYGGFSGDFEVSELYDSPCEGQVVEVGSIMRVSEISRRQFMKTFGSDFKPRTCDRVGWRHSWYNRDGLRSGCHNCRTVRKGHLWEKQGL